MAQATHNDVIDYGGGRSCPSEDDLFAFAEGRLPEPQSGSVFRHLTQCGKCEEAMLRLSDESSVAMRLKDGEPNCPLLEEPECGRMQHAARGLPARLDSKLDQKIEDANQESTDTTRLSTENVPRHVARAPGEATTAVRPTTGTIGRYQVRSILGEGSYGRVYLAYDPELDRQVALKVPKFGGQVPQSLISAFLREAKVAAKLKHPGIVAVYDAGYDDHAGCFIVMEYVDGQSLKHRIAEGKIPHEEAAKLVAQAAEAVHHAHKQGLVHRDLKPANLLIDTEGNLKVADFGLAILEEQQRELAGEFAGTMAYCSPEQIRGEVHHLDGRTDIYSLGVILYELLTGRRPFGGKHDQMTDEILHRPPKPPRQIDDTVPRELERVCTTCLNKAAQHRYSSALDLTASLRPWTARSRPSIFRRRTMFALGVMTSLLIAATASIIWVNDLRSANLSIKSPNVVAWEPKDLRDDHGYDEQDKCYRFDAYGHALFSVTTVNEDTVDLTMDFSVEDWKGRANIFWGLHRTPDDDRSLRCWSVSVGRIKEGKPLSVDLCEYVIGPGGNVTNSSCLKTIRCDEPFDESASLRVRGGPGVVNDIWLNEQPLLSEPYRFSRPTAARAPYAVGFGGQMGDISISRFAAN